MLKAFAFLTLLLLSLVTSVAAQEAAAPETTPPAPTETVQPQVTVDDLIRLLENDETRAQLIARLRDLAAAGGERSSASPVAAEAPAEEISLTRQVAKSTRDLAEAAARGVGAVATALTGLWNALLGAGSADLAGVWTAVESVLFVALALAVTFMVLRLITGRIRRRLIERDRQPGAEGWFARLFAVVLSTLLDAVMVIATWGAGYVVALQVIGGATGLMNINQSLLLNAFLVVELSKLAARLLFSPRWPSLRLLPLSDTTAAYWYLWTARLVTLLGYSFLFVAPVIAAVNPSAAFALLAVAMFSALVIGIVIVLQNRTKVRRFLERRRLAGGTDALARGGAALGRVWHLLAIFYLVAIFVAWVVSPGSALRFMLAATVESLIAIAIGIAIVAAVTGFVSVGLRLPESWKQRLPLLERRLNSFVPNVLRVVRFLVAICVALAILHAWDLIDAVGWLGSSAARGTVGALTSAGVIVLIGGIVYILVSSWVEYRLNPNYGTAPTTREKTLLSLFKNAFTIALGVLVVMLALSQLGIDIGPLLAGAGVLGLAIGFGAQKLVQDIITGVFIQFENIMNEGDVVTAGGISGVVEKLTIRSVSIRDLSGTLHLVPFSSVDSVSNMMKGFAFHVAEIGVAYREDIGEVKAAMLEAFDRLMETEHKDAILEPLDLQGIIAFGDSAIVVRARIKTLPGKQWGVGRAYSEFIKQVFDARGIDIPFPHLTLYMGQDKKGNAPPLHLVEDRGAGAAPALPDGPRSD